MLKPHFLYWSFFVSLIVAGCTMEIEQPQIETPVAQVNTPGPLASATDSLPTTQIPVTWASLNLTGSLVYTAASKKEDTTALSMEVLDLVTGETKTIFTTISYAWIYYAAVSPDGAQAIISYSPPSQVSSGAETSLYVMPLDGTKPPQILFTPPTPDDRYIQVELSPDGKYIYYVHYNQNETPGQFYQTYHIFRMAYPDGKPEKILDQAFWPRISPDSSKIVYVSLDPAIGINELFLANTDGSNPQKIVLSGSSVPEIIDAPIFSPDGKSILFSAPDPGQSSYEPNWFDKLTGVQIVKAHNVPSDWWLVPITGGELVRLTQIQVTRLFADISPDQKHIFSASGNSIFVMDPDGSDLTYLISPIGGIAGTVRWIP
jgi:Tol biopolymer transport system component